jgi:serine/threonine protein kinase
VTAKKTFRTDPVPTWIDEDRRYRLIRRLIEDPLGQLWRGQDVLLQAAVTIRLLRKPEGFDRLELVERRLDLAADELRHPNVATVLDHGVGEPVPVRFVVIERLRGVPLARRLSATVGMAPREAVAIAVAVGLGLEAIHLAGLAHEALTPHSVFLPPEGGVKVIDLGLAGVFPDRETAGDGSAEDVRCLGSLLADMLASSPHRPGTSEIDIVELLGAEGAAVWRASIDPDPSNRPELSELGEALRTAERRLAAARSVQRERVVKVVREPRGTPGTTTKLASEPKPEEDQSAGAPPPSVTKRSDQASEARTPVPAMRSSRSRWWLAPVATVAAAVALLVPALDMSPPPEPAPPDGATRPAPTGRSAIVMPDLRGLSIQQAALVLERTDLTLGERVEALGEAGVVLATDPGLGQIVPPGTPVTVYAGTGMSGAEAAGSG